MSEIIENLKQIGDVAKAAKETVESVRKSHQELDGRVAKIHEELKSGMVDATSKAAYQDAVAKVAKHEETLDKLNKEITELAQKSANMMQQGQERKSIGQLAAESEEAKTYRGGNAVLVEHNGPLFAKAASTSAAPIPCMTRAAKSQA